MVKIPQCRWHLVSGNIAFDEVTLCHNLDVESTISAGYDSNTIVRFFFFPDSKKPPHAEQRTPLPCVCGMYIPVEVI